MDMKKAKINGRLMSVVSLEDYNKNPELYTQSSTAIEIKDQNLVLPIIGKYDNNPGIYVSSGELFSTINVPDNEDEYSLDRVIDLSDTKNMKELMEKQELIRDIEFEMLTTVDNIFSPKIGENCSPAMRALKTAVIEKKIDINKYGDRFGSNFNNDKRQYNKDTISMQMLERQCNGLDIKATLILEDASEDVPNPIGRKIVVELTEGGDSNDD